MKFFHTPAVPKGFAKKVWPRLSEAFVRLNPKRPEGVTHLLAAELVCLEMRKSSRSGDPSCSLHLLDCLPHYTPSSSRNGAICVNVRYMRYELQSDTVWFLIFTFATFFCLMLFLAVHGCFCPEMDDNKACGRFLCVV